MSRSNGNNSRENTAKKKQAFLAAYRECGTIRYAAEAVRMSRRTHYAWMERDADYAEEFDKATADAADYLEAEARRRAAEGVKKLKFYKGEPIIDPETKEPYFEHEYSDVLLIFLLKGALPEKYRERASVKMEGDGERVAGMDRDEAIRRRAESMLKMIEPKDN